MVNGDEALLFERLKMILVRELSVSEASVGSDAHIIPDLNADSFDLVQLVMVIEDELGITIPDGDVDCRWTVGELYTYIEARLREDQEIK